MNKPPVIAMGNRTQESPQGTSETASQSDSPAAKYQGLKKWGWYIDDREKWVSRFSNAGKVNALEIGAFDGVSSNVMLDILFRNRESRVCCIDPYLPDPTTPQVDGHTRDVFMENVSIGGHERQIQLFDGTSAKVLSEMNGAEEFREAFDFIYVDASHQARHVFMDAAMSWNLLKVGGTIVFDDYGWGKGTSVYGRPKAAIDAFSAVFGDRIQEVLNGYRKGYRKLAG